eukprot:PITA_22987
MDEELGQIEKNNTWELVPRPKDKNVIGTKWIFKNKLNENGEVIRSKARLVCKGYAQQEGIDFEETFASKEFEMSMLGELTYFLGLQIQQNEGGIFLSQTKYLKQILKKYGMEDAKPVCTPMVTGCNLSANDELAAMHQPTYRSMIGSLLYLSDADWAGSMDDRKSTSGGAFFMGSRLVSWFSKKQSSIALSTLKQNMCCASCFVQLLWMMQTLQDFQITCTPPISILCDNTSAINISKNPVMHSKTKHIPIKYHFLREQVLEQKVKLEYVPSKEQGVDIFTKPLPRETFEYLRQKLGVVDVSSCC